MQGNNLDHDLIGENMHNGPPINRNQIYQTNKCPGQFYEWSELKSSYFVKNIIKDQTYNSVLVNRMKTHAQYLSGICNLKKKYFNIDVNKNVNIWFFKSTW